MCCSMITYPEGSTVPQQHLSALRCSLRIIKLARCVCVVLTMCLLPCCTEGPDTSKDAKSEVEQVVGVKGEVVLYCSVDQVYAEQLLADFCEMYPDIDVRVRYDTEVTKTTGLVQRLRAEQKAPKADVFWSSEVFSTIRLAEDGLLQPFEHDAAAEWPALYHDPEFRWFGFANRARVIAYDPNRITVEIPETWLDLAKPRFKDRVVMANPAYGTTRGHVAAWFVIWGDVTATQFLHDLNANGLRLVASNSQAVREVVNGYTEFAITDTDDVWAMQRNGHALGVVYPNHLDGADMGGQEGGGTLCIPNTVGVVADRPMTDAVRLLVEYLLSGAVERYLYESDSHNIPIRVDDLEIAAMYLVPDPMDVDYATIAAEMDTAIPRAVEILSR